MGRERKKKKEQKRNRIIKKGRMNERKTWFAYKHLT